ncbi:carboxylate--amine ligase [Halogeometricum limi]|uniref:Predicted ATP-dependent carboligase, ATP-grasp superfamily n=1 Tax=Halogeometricum limi TaxID=555875 RepID=A0A1I6ILR9_9EURY|nr:carboxylate--amine ligase [Halogeometricum limi]SFR67601.1 Predicted ATP-dependent carboligase, ATP-grasp superfamily [Halogeometricum limi]
MTEFHSLDDLVAELESRTFDRPPALVANAHITGLGVARALSAHGVPVIALDRVGDGVAPPSEAVDVAGAVTYPLDDLAGFRADVERVAAAFDHEPVAFGCMDEWVLALAEARPAGVRLSFAPDTVERVLDKERLYAAAERLDVPYPETYRLAGVGDRERGADAEADSAAPPLVDPEEAAERLGYPLVVKPARKREFEELVGTNVVVASDEAAFADAVATARDAGVRVMAQQHVDSVPGEDRSFASYRRLEGGDTVGLVANPVVRHPRGLGSSCVVDRIESPHVRERGLSVLEDAGYRGISEAEFVRDPARDEDVLLDVNTRPWKWIGLPVAAGVDLPGLAYVDALGDGAPASVVESVESVEPVADRWVSLRDYLAELAGSPTMPDVVSRAEWTALAAGVPGDAGVVAAVFDPADPGPTARLLETEFGDADYYCSC